MVGLRYSNSNLLARVSRFYIQPLWCLFWVETRLKYEGEAIEGQLTAWCSRFHCLNRRRQHSSLPQRNSPGSIRAFFFHGTRSSLYSEGSRCRMLTHAPSETFALQKIHAKDRLSFRETNLPAIQSAFLFQPAPSLIALDAP